MRIRTITPRHHRSHQIYTHRPFEDQGVSLYVSVAESVQYRNLRIVGNGYLQSPNWVIGTGDIEKTARVAFEASPVSSISVPVDTDWQSQTLAVDVRTFADDVENNSDNYRIARIDLDGSGVAQDTIQGVATLLGVEARSGGICVIRIAFANSTTGLQATLLTAVRTAGPTTPANIEVEVESGRVVYEFTTEVLMEVGGSPYTFKIQGTAGATTADLLTGITVTVDSTGPDAPISGSGVAW